MKKGIELRYELQLTETEWTKKICDGLKGKVIITSLVASKMSKHGIADRHFISRDWSGFVEFKGEDTPITKSQVLFHSTRNNLVSGSCWIWRQPDKHNTTSRLIRLEYIQPNRELISTGLLRSALDCLTVMSDCYGTSKV